MTERSIFKQTSLLVFLGLLAYMPLHIFLSTWLGTSFGILAFAKVFKDVVMAAGFIAAVTASVRESWFKELLRNKLIWFIAGYGLLTALLAIVKATQADAEILGTVYNLRFFIFFLYGVLLAQLYKGTGLVQKVIKVVVGVAVTVFLFGLVQYLVLPDAALTHVGYSRNNGVLPAFFIDNKSDLERIMSTLRDPNSFGSYCIIVLSLATGYFVSDKRRAVRKVVGGIILLAGLCLLLTFSRSALLGGLLTLTVMAVMLARKKSLKITKKIVLVAAGVLLVAVLLLVPLRNTYFMENIIFHADESTTMEDPNQLRLRFWRESLRNASTAPLGNGPGTAGLVSIRNEAQGTVLNENYYLQVLHEVGFLGLGLFLAILWFVGKGLYKRARTDTLALCLLASFVGLAFTNLLVHIWSNEAVAYTWWGVAGTVLAAGWFKPEKGVKRGRIS